MKKIRMFAPSSGMGRIFFVLLVQLLVFIPGNSSTFESNVQFLVSIPCIFSSGRIQSVNAACHVIVLL